MSIRDYRLTDNRLGIWPSNKYWGFRKMRSLPLPKSAKAHEHTTSWLILEVNENQTCKHYSQPSFCEPKLHVYFLTSFSKSEFQCRVLKTNVFRKQTYKFIFWYDSKIMEKALSSQSCSLYMCWHQSLTCFKVFEVVSFQDQITILKSEHYSHWDIVEIIDFLWALKKLDSTMRGVF